MTDAPALVPHTPVELVVGATLLPDGTAIVAVVTLVAAYAVAQITHQQHPLSD
jgi:hypothetical protein